MAFTQDELDQLKNTLAQGIETGFKKYQPTNNQPGTRSGPPGGSLESALGAGSDGLKGAFGDMIGVLNNGKGNLADFGSMVSKVGDGLGSAFTNIPMIGGALGDALKGLSGAVAFSSALIQDNADMFRYLSKVGGGFNGDLGKLRIQAAEAGLGLQDYAELISENGQIMSMFAGGVDGGAEAISELGRGLFETGMIDQFMNMGMTVKESNEFLIRNLALTRRSSLFQNKSTQEQISAANELAIKMMTMSKLTGKNIQEMQNEMMERNRSGKSIAALRLLEMDGILNAEDARAAMQTGLEGAPKVMKDLMDDLIATGVPMSEATKNFAAINGEAYNLAMQAREALQRGDTAEAERLTKEATAATLEFAKSRQGLTLATLSDVSDVAQTQADALAEINPLITQIEQHVGRTGDVIEGFNLVVEEMTQKVRDTAAGTMPGTEVFGAVRETEQVMSQLAAQVNRLIGEGLSSEEMMSAMQSYTQTLENVSFEELEDKIQGMITTASSLVDRDPIDTQTAELEKLINRKDENIAFQLQAGKEPVTAEEIYTLMQRMKDPNSSVDDQQAAFSRLQELNVLDKDKNVTEAYMSEKARFQKKDFEEVEASDKRIEYKTMLDDLSESIGGFVNETLDSWSEKFNKFINEDLGLQAFLDKFESFSEKFMKFVNEDLGLQAFLDKFQSFSTSLGEIKDSFSITIDEYTGKLRDSIDGVVEWYDEMTIAIDDFIASIKKSYNSITEWTKDMQTTIQEFFETPFNELWNEWFGSTTDNNEKATVGMFTPQSSTDLPIQIEDPVMPNQTISKSLAKLEDIKTNVPNRSDVATAKEYEKLAAKIQPEQKTITDRQYQELIDATNKNTEILNTLALAYTESQPNRMQENPDLTKLLTDLNTTAKQQLEINTQSMNLTKKSLSLNNDQLMYA
tara:strand:+ start:2223 stop:4967 length:2745 start_codon:yes stop_codon:yes gene_type:complete